MVQLSNSATITHHPDQVIEANNIFGKSYELIDIFLDTPFTPDLVLSYNFGPENIFEPEILQFIKTSQDVIEVRHLAPHNHDETVMGQINDDNITLYIENMLEEHKDKIIDLSLTDGDEIQHFFHVVR